MDLFNTQFLFASLFWGSVGMGYLIYGKKQGEWVPAFGGLAMIAISYFVGSALLMSLLGLALIVGVYWLVRRG